jgi:hypothetical protein
MIFFCYLDLFKRLPFGVEDAAMSFCKRRQRMTATIAFIIFNVITTNGDPQLSEARSAVSQWVEVEKTISDETLAWEEKKQLLERMAAVAEAEIAMIKDQLKEIKDTADMGKARRAELVKQEGVNAGLSAKIKVSLLKLEPQLRTLLPRIPKPLAEKLRPLMERLPKNPEESSIDISARMQSVIGIITEIQRFDRLVTTGEELLTFPSGKTREIYTIHFGLGASYFVTSDGTAGGIGVNTAESWAWESKQELAASIKSAISLANGNFMEPGFLYLPVTPEQTQQ